MMLKRICGLSFLIIWIFWLPGCGSTHRRAQSAEEVVSMFCSALQRGDTEAVKDYYAGGIKADGKSTENSLNLFPDELAYEMVEVCLQNLDQISFEIGNVTKLKGGTSVEVTFTYLDASGTVALALLDILSDFSMNMDEEEMMRAFEKAFCEHFINESKKEIFCERSCQFICKSTENGWIITDLPKDDLDNILSGNTIGAMKNYY